MAYLGWPWSPLALVKNSVSQARVASGLPGDGETFANRWGLLAIIFRNHTVVIVYEKL